LLGATAWDSLARYKERYAGSVSLNLDAPVMTKFTSNVTSEEPILFFLIGVFGETFDLFTHDCLLIFTWKSFALQFSTGRVIVFICSAWLQDYHYQGLKLCTYRASFI
ncbi:hypothetical protein ACJX0J_021488, partial [Zea mays]